MLFKGIRRRMYDLCFEGRWRWTHHFLLVWVSLLAAAPPKALGYFLGDTKAVLKGCEDHWTLQDRAAMPLLFQMTVCVNVRVVVPGAWVAFSYSSVHAPRPELGLEGDDEALYGWLLRVRHRFPLRLSPTDWHRVCLRRDVRRNSFSLEVDEKMVAERTVIARAIPPSGSLWLGCRPRDRPPGAALGEVELYLFRMWADLRDHGPCEDGTVIGWNALYWGLTSPKARQSDPDLPCAITPGVGRLFTAPPEVTSTTTTLNPVIATPVTHLSNETSQVTGSSFVNCNISQLCSSKNAYFWMSVSVEAEEGSKTEQDVHNLVSNAFGCHGGGDEVTGFMDFCQDDRQLQVVQVNCKAQSNIRKTTCDVVLQLSHAVSVCELQRAGVSALQQAAGDEQIQARIVGEVERVGRDLCEDVAPSGGRFVRCSSTSSLDDICQTNKQSNLTCSLIKPDSKPAPRPQTESCSREAPRFCDCTAFCNSASQFFAIRININSASVSVDLLKSLLSGLSVAGTCNTMPGSTCQDSEISKHYQGAHLECHGTQQRLYSCMVILEMSGPVNSCSLSKLMQQVIESNAGITNERPLTRMVVCGPPGLPVRTLLMSNLTWVASDLLTSDVCQPDPTLLKCEANEMLAVLLTDSCSPTTKQSTSQPPTLPNSSITKTPEVSSTSGTNTTEQTQSTAENTAAGQQTNASRGTAQPHTTAPLTTTQSSTSRPVLQQNTTLSDRTTVQNTTLSYNTTLTPTEKIAEFTTLYSVNPTQQTTTTAPIDSTLNSAAPNHTTVYNVTTTDTCTPSPNDTTAVTKADNNLQRYLHNDTTSTSNTTINTFTLSPNHTAEYKITTADSNYTTADTFTPSPNGTTVYNAPADGTITTSTATITTSAATITTSTAPPNHTATYSVTTADNNRSPHNGTVTKNNATTGAYTTFPNHTAEYNATTAGSYRKQHNGTTTTTNTTVNTFTPSPDHTAVYSVTTAAKNYTATSNSHTTVDTFTPSPNDTMMYKVTTVGNNRNLHNGTTTSNTTMNRFTTSSNHTAEYNETTASNNYTTEYNLTTATPSPSEYNITTANYITQHYTAEYNITTADNNRKLHNGTVTTINATISTFTPTPNRTAVYNTTTATNNYTTASNNNTTEYSTTTADNNRNPHNGTITTTNPTLNNATTSTKTSTVDNMTSAVNNTTKPTVAPLIKHTGNRNTVTHNITANNENDMNSTTAATVVTPSINDNETAEIRFNLNSTVSNSTTDFNLTTKEPGVSLSTTAVNPSLAHITSNTPGPHLTQISTNIAKVSSTSSTTTLQATTFTKTTTTKPGTGTTPTTTAETTKSQETQEEQADELLDQTQDASQLNSSQVAQLADQLEKLLDGPTVSQAVGQKAVNIISNLMEGDSLALSASANRLIRVVDDLGLKLVVAGDREIISSKSLVLAVRTVDGTNFPTTSVDIFNTDDVQLRALSRSGSTRSGSPLGSVFLPSSLTEGLSPEQQRQASRVQFTFYTRSALFQDAALDNQTLVSPVLGSSVANLSISNLSENVQFTIRNINPVHANYAASCAFWDFTLNAGGGGWSSVGCSLVNITPEDTTCSCNHLTSFAILLDLSREGITERRQAQILTFITFIGCGISAIFLAATLLTYLSFEKLLRDIPAKILIQLCMSLLLLNLVFLLDGWLALYPATGLCISTAFFLHYFLLTSFTWAGLEALHMYLSVIQVFTPYLSRYMLKFSLMGWGVPLVVVIVVISVDKDNYGLVTYGKYTDGSSDDFCWLRNDVAFYVGVVAYFILIFALCLLVFVMVMVQLARIKKQNPQNQSPNRGVMTDLRSIAGLIILLGLTWGFALFAWGPLYLPFVYLFSIFNSLQGFLVFVFHCAVKENVRRQWRTYLCCGRLRLAENSEWSRTATQNNRNMSVMTATTSAAHFTSRSSSVISDGSVFGDSGISDGYSSDVVLNEIHRRNLSL